jgi:hypothetical protein
VGRVRTAHLRGKYVKVLVGNLKLRKSPLRIGKLKVKLSLCFLTEHHSVRAYWGSGCIAPHIL